MFTMLILAQNYTCEMADLTKALLQTICENKRKELILTMDEWSIEPLYVVVFWKGEQDLITDNWEWQEEDGSSRNCQCECTQVHTAFEKEKADSLC